MPSCDLSSSSSAVPLERYYDAFAHFLKSGEIEGLSNFIEVGSPDVCKNYLHIYRNGFFKSCIDALSNNFSCTSKIFGREKFIYLARLFVTHYPPKEGSLSAYGINFPDFLAKHSNISYAKDIALLDWSWLSCLYATSCESLSAEKVRELDHKGVDISKIKVKLTPASRLVNVQHDVFALWQNSKLNESITHIPNTLAKKSTIFFWQLDHQVIAKTLDIEEALFFQYIQNGDTLGKSAENLLKAYPNTDVSNIFSNLLTNNILVEE